MLNRKEMTSLTTASSHHSALGPQPGSGTQRVTRQTRGRRAVTSPEMRHPPS